jgi:hypothetical protein
MESVVDVFKKRSNKMDTTDSEANWATSQAIAE